MSDGNYLAADRMPEGLEGWQTVEVYCQSRGSHMRPGRWSSHFVEHLQPWHVWRYEAPSPGDELMAKSAGVRERMGVKALEGNGFYVGRKDGDSCSGS
jgi:predicted RNA binding protein YcfA (HicA-like mRNA interferase family)